MNNSLAKIFTHWLFVTTLTAFAHAGAADVKSLTFVTGSTTKLEQLIGDVDKQKNAPTRNQTFTRYRIQGTDLGYSFEHEGQVYFLFGDTMGRWGGDVIGVSKTADPERGLQLDFLTEDNGNYLKVEPANVSMKGFEVPVSGISLDGKMYVVVKTNHSPNKPTDTSVLTLFDARRKTFTPLREISRLPNGRFIKMSMREAPESITDLPPGGPYVLIWGSGVYRASDAYLALVPKAQFESGKGTQYFAGLDGERRPIWSDKESAAKPIVEHPTIGDLSVTWSSALRLWLMTYDSRDPRGIVFRYSPTPWGPWSPAQVIFNVNRDNGDAFIHQAGRQDGLEGPVIGQGQANPIAVQGGAYAPYVVERFTRLDGEQLGLYYLLSTWNPYVVVLMKSAFKVVTP